VRALGTTGNGLSMRRIGILGAALGSVVAMTTVGGPRRHTRRTIRTTTRSSLRSAPVGWGSVWTRKFDREFREGAVRIGRETNKPIAQVAADLGIHAGTLANWVKQDKIARGEAEGLTGDERAELARLRAETAELRMEQSSSDRWSCG